MGIGKKDKKTCNKIKLRYNLISDVVKFNKNFYDTYGSTRRRKR